jgi:hypothetical protein
MTRDSYEETVPMDRLNRIVTHGGLALLLGASVSSLGCRSMKSEIPPGKPYSTTGAPASPTTPSVGFSSDPRPDASAGAGLYNGIQQASGATGPGGLPGGVQQAGGGLPAGGDGTRPQFGTPIGNQNSYKDAIPATGRYGPPGTSGMPTTSPLPPSLPAADASTPPPPVNPLQGGLGVDLPGAQ